MPSKDSQKTAFQEDAERVTRLLRQEIYSGIRMPRERLVESALSGTFRASLMGIRQALSRLQAEGLVQIEPYKGASVSAVSPGDLFEGYQVLAMLEGFAAQLAAEQMTGKDMDRLNRLLDRHRRLGPADVKAHPVGSPRTSRSTHGWWRRSKKGMGEKARHLMERHILGAGEYLTQHLKKALPSGMFA